MNQFETINFDDNPNGRGLDPEALAEVPPEVVGDLGYIALAATQSNKEYIADGLKLLEAHANGEAVPEDTRVHDIEAAHEAALIENEIFDAHVAALKENEVFDAHVAALKEDKERNAAIAKAREDGQKITKDETPAKPNPDSTQRLYEEASTALNQAGIDPRLSPTSTVTKDAMGNMLILEGDYDAKLITQSADGSPKVTAYHYDKDSGTLTIDAGHFSALPHKTTYEKTSLKGWQSNQEGITLPPAIAKRFGVNRAIATRES